MAREEHAKRIVLGDTSALIGLAAAGGFDLLQRLFGALHVTSAVRDEVLAGRDRPGVAELRAALDAGWLHVTDHAPKEPLFPNIGEGEASTLRAALAAGPESLVVLDDRLAREIATALGITHVGTLGVILVAKRRGLIKKVSPYFEALNAHGFHVPDTLLSALLRDAGEE